MKPENIKAVVNFHFEGDNKPFKSIEEYGALKNFFDISGESPVENPIQTIEIEGVRYKIKDVKTSVFNETRSSHLQRGVDTSLEGELLPYNFRVLVILKRD